MMGNQPSLALINTHILKENELEQLKRYVGGLSDEKEKALVESLFVNGEENHDLHFLLEKDWNSLLRDPSPSEADLGHLLDHIHHVIRTREQQKNTPVLLRLARIYRKVAAILLLPLIVAGGLAYHYLTNHEKATTEAPVRPTIFAPLGSRVSFQLPDGTSGMLNSGSHLTYSLPFTNNRQVELQGEAWFEVSRDEQHPFQINTGNATVNVLGTSFNLMAYPAENYVEVVLKEGKVMLTENSRKESINMLPSERLVFRDGKMSKSVTDPSKYSAWTKGRMVFINDPMTEVARRIERWYNVQVILADRGLEKYSFRGTFEDDSLEEVFRLLSLTSPIRYKITPRKLLNDGTFEKEKVTIYLKKPKY